MKCFVRIFFPTIFFFLFTSAIFASANTRTDRIALVIGNSAYKSSPLTNPRHDAEDMAAALKQCGFEVNKVLDADRQSMRKAIRAFGLNIQKGGVGLFYYAGHGIQVDGENFLVPIHTDVYSEAEVEDECLRVSAVLRQMESAGNRLNIIILDACRDNPFTRSFRSGSRGLAKMDAPTGSILAYATAPGSVAADGTDENGLYTQALLKHMMIPGLEVEKVFKLARIDVIESSGKRQVPWESSSLIGDFYFLYFNEEIQMAAPIAAKDLQSYTIQKDLKDAIGYYSGTIGEVDDVKARSLILKTSRQEDPLARMWAARCYFKGRSGFPEDIAKAKKLASGSIQAIKHLASQGLTEAMFLLASAYEEGIGITRDYGKAIDWYRKAAENGYSMAMINLGSMYKYGREVQADSSLAIQWYRRAASRNNPVAMNWIGRMYEGGLGVAKDYKAALQWYRKAVAYEEYWSMNNIGVMYRKGLGVPQDDTKAAYWYQKAAAKELPVAMNNLGWLYKEGLGVPLDDGKAVIWFRRAAEKGEPDAMNNLGNMYLSGRGVAKDSDAAVKWYRKAAEKDGHWGMYNLGWLYAEGLGVPQDDKQAVHWYRKAAEKENPSAMNNLGFMYEQGRGLPMDEDMACRWYEKASEHGDERAKINLKKCSQTSEGKWQIE